METVIYGIKNCDTMKKARQWLNDHGVSYRFHDYKAAGVTREIVDDWVRRVGWEAVLNRAGTTFRKLDEDKKQDLNDEKAVALMLDQPSMIKRPVLISEGRILVGFKPDDYRRLFTG